MGNEFANRDRAIARIAGRQHGVLSTAQLEAVGIQRPSISKRVAAGRLHRVFRGVYAVGHAGLSNEGRWMAAVLACGEGAVLSHRSAAELWGMLQVDGGPIHVITRRSAGRRHLGLCAHRSPSLTVHETTRYRAIAVTTPARTLADLSRVVSDGLVRKATRQAEYLRLPLGEIETDGTRSDLERSFVGLCRRHRLPTPEVNQRIGPYTVDFLWRDERVVVETDAYATHRGRQAFEDDRARELYLHGLGMRVRRFSARQLEAQPKAVVAAIRRELALWLPSGKQRRQTRS
jgi:very-short-patch-repair endonuclease